MLEEEFALKPTRSFGQDPEDCSLAPGSPRDLLLIL